MNSSKANSSRLSKLRGSKNVEQMTVMQRTASIWRMAINKRMLVFLPQLLWTGVSIAYYSGILVSVISDSVVGATESEQQYKSVLCMIAFGCGEVLGCFFIGNIIDRYSGKIATFFILGIIVIMTGVSVTFIIIN